MADCRQVNYYQVQVQVHNVNSAFHPLRVGKSSTVPACLAGVNARCITCVGWQVTLRDDPIQQVLHDSEMGYIDKFNLFLFNL